MELLIVQEQGGCSLSFCLFLEKGHATLCEAHPSILVSFLTTLLHEQQFYSNRGIAVLLSFCHFLCLFYALWCLKYNLSRHSFGVIALYISSRCYVRLGESMSRHIFFLTKKTIQQNIKISNYVSGVPKNA